MIMGVWWYDDRFSVLSKKMGIFIGFGLWLFDSLLGKNNSFADHKKMMFCLSKWLMFQKAMSNWSYINVAFLSAQRVLLGSPFQLGFASYFNDKDNHDIPWRGDLLVSEIPGMGAPGNRSEAVLTDWETLGDGEEMWREHVETGNQMDHIQPKTQTWGLKTGSRPVLKPLVFTILFLMK